MRKMSFRNPERKSNSLRSLSNALANRDKSAVNTGTFTPPMSRESQSDNWGEGASKLLNGGMKLYNGLNNSGLFGGGNDSIGIVGDAANDYINGVGGDSYGIFGDAANSYISGGNLGSSSAIGDAIGAEVGNGSGGFGGGFMPYMGVAMGGLRAGQSALEGGNLGEDVPQSFFGIDDENDSEIMQAIKGAGQGASMGSAFGPWGAAIGGVLGLGASFLDDI